MVPRPSGPTLLLLLIVLVDTSVYVLFLVMTRCTYVSTNFGGLRPTYSYVDLRTKMSVSCMFCVL
jgi:hypothetical protein